MGNYWSDYGGSDENGDGIGDTPYPVVYPGPPVHYDYYPLMQPWEKYFMPEYKPYVEISTDKSKYTAGETMLINITLGNPGTDKKTVKFLWQLKVYDYNITKTIVDNKTIVLPPEYERTYSFRWTLPSLGVTFNASWFVAIFSEDVICEDYADWMYSGKVKAKKLSEINVEGIEGKI